MTHQERIATDSAEPLPGRPSAPLWNLGTLFAFRCCFAFALLEWVSFGLSSFTSLLTRELVPRPNWWRPLNVTLGQWLIVHVLNLEGRSPERMSGNSLPLFLGMLGVAAISVIIGLVWSAVDRRGASHPRLFGVLHTLLRFELATVMLAYGWAKVFPNQFPVSLDYMALEVAQHNPRDLLWAFMGGSRGYQVFTGLVEVSGALFLLPRRTAMLGALISAAAMANVLALDIAYDAPVKFTAGLVFSMSLFVLAPYAKGLFHAFGLSRAVPTTQGTRLLPPVSADGVARAGGLLLAVWIAWATFQSTRTEVAQNELARQTPLYGIWDVEEMTKNGSSVPLLITDETLWRRLIVQSRGASVIVPMTEAAPREAWTGRPNPVRYGLQLDEASHTVTFSGRGERLVFAYALPDPDHLVLTSRKEDDTTVVRLRRFDLSAYPLMNWERHWNW